MARDKSPFPESRRKLGSFPVPMPGEADPSPAVQMSEGPVAAPRERAFGGYVSREQLTPYVEYYTPYSGPALCGGDGALVRSATFGDKSVGGVPSVVPASSASFLSCSDPTSLEFDRTCEKAKQVAELVGALTDDKRVAQRAVLQAVASLCGIDAAELDPLIDGTCERKIEAPQPIRVLLTELDLKHTLAPVNLFEFGAWTGEVMANEAMKWEDLEIEVALDSGSVVHVISEGDTPCYALDSSPAARQCNEFIVGDGGTMKNHGQKKLNLSTGSSDFSSVFQIAAVHRPLMSVGRICDNDNSVVFNKTRAVVLGSDGAEICVFTRSPGGLYTAKLKLTSPFGRPER